MLSISYSVTQKSLFLKNLIVTCNITNQSRFNSLISSLSYTNHSRFNSLISLDLSGLQYVTNLLTILKSNLPFEVLILSYIEELSGIYAFDFLLLFEILIVV
jgi:hypothetical protein